MIGIRGAIGSDEINRLLVEKYAREAASTTNPIWSLVEEEL
jgi:hypothetical protein